MTDPADILNQVEAFLNKTGMAPTTFGIRSTGDRHLVRQMRQGRELRRALRSKVADFIASYSEATPEPAR